LTPHGEGDARQEIDARGLVVLPGVVDGHAHVNEPGRTEWEGWVAATRGAAAGGVTTIADMPLNSVPPTIDGAAFDAKYDAASARGRAHGGRTRRRRRARDGCVGPRRARVEPRGPRSGARRATRGCGHHRGDVPALPRL